MKIVSIRMKMVVLIILTVITVSLSIVFQSVLTINEITEQNIAANILRYQTGALNIDTSRIPTDDQIPKSKSLDFKTTPFFGYKK